VKLQTGSLKFVPRPALTAEACLVPTVTSLGAVAGLFDHVTVKVGVVTANIGSIQQFVLV
jgi:hypothetical protein